MFCSSRPLGLLRSVVCLSLLGVAVIVLIGPACWPSPAPCCRSP